MQHHYFVIEICSFFNQQWGQIAGSELISSSFLFSSAVGYPVAANKLYFLKSIGQDYLLPILLVKKPAHVHCTESGFLFQRCTRSPSSTDAIAEIKRTAGVCGAKA
jgi:hypothetical protein